jgi:DNA polymerase III epsilon subunit family exonuclease
MQQSLFSLFQPTTSADTPATANLPVLPGERPLEGLVFTVLDIETTGLHPKKNAITEITAIQYLWQNGHPTEQRMLTTLVKPNDPISPEIQNITGITEAMVANAPDPRTVLQQFLDLIGPNPVLVGHNVAFDIGFIREKLQQYGLPHAMVTTAHGVCTRNLARKLVPGLPGYEGVVVAHACGVINDNPHRAEADVRMAAGILFHLLGKPLPNVATLADLQAIQGPLKG